MPRNADKTHKRILDAAHRQFRRRGYSRVSMDEIAGATKVTKRTLYYHFESKDALLTAVLEAQHLLALAAFRTFGDRLFRFGRGHHRRPLQGACGLGGEAALGGIGLHAPGD